LLLNHIGPTVCAFCGSQQAGHWEYETEGEPICNVCQQKVSSLENPKVVHTLENQIRIRHLSTREQAIVLTDGGNTVESQLRVLDTIELHPPDSNNKRVWFEVPLRLPSGKETIEYYCRVPSCDYREVKSQKARQHFVACHVAEGCWGCSIDGCTHIGKYKRLDDLKHHHLVPLQGIDYTRSKKRI